MKIFESTLDSEIYSTSDRNMNRESSWGKGRRTPFQTHYFSGNLVAPVTEPGPLDL
jgi:hypothetical protein